MKYIFFALSLCFCTFLQAADVDRVVVEKSKHRLLLLNEDTRVREFSVAFGGEPQGHKQQEGDQKHQKDSISLIIRRLIVLFIKQSIFPIQMLKIKHMLPKKGLTLVVLL